MFCDFFGMREEPFGVTPDARFLYLSETHREAFASLTYRLQSGRGFVGVVAPPGMGKTTLLFRLLQDLRETARTAFIFQTQCTPLDFMRHLIADLGLGVAAEDPFRLYQLLKTSLLREASNGRQIVIVVDEAQNLSDVVLEQIRLLSDIETPRAKLLQIVLSGQPQLATKLAQPDLLQLQQRFSIISHLKPFSLTDTTQYVEHRLKIAGRSGPRLFSRGAVEEVARFSGGVPRLINNICFGALSVGFASRSRLIGVEQVREAAADLGLINETCVQSDSGQRIVTGADGAAEHNISQDDNAPREAGIVAAEATSKVSAQHASRAAANWTPSQQSRSHAPESTLSSGDAAITIKKRKTVTRNALVLVAAMALLLTGFFGFRFLPRREGTNSLRAPAANKIALLLSHKQQPTQQPLPAPSVKESTPSILEKRHVLAKKNAPITLHKPPAAKSVARPVSVNPATVAQPKPVSEREVLEPAPSVKTPDAHPVVPVSVSQNGQLKLSQETAAQPMPTSQGNFLVSFPDTQH